MTDAERVMISTKIRVVCEILANLKEDVRFCGLSPDSSLFAELDKMLHDSWKLLRKCEYHDLGEQ